MEGTETENQGARKDYVWVEYIEAVSELTRFNFNEVYRMAAVEFLAYLVYVDFKRRKEKQEIEKFKNKMK